MLNYATIKPKYRCKQSVLYQVCQQLIVQLNENLAHFTKFKSKYTPIFLENLQSQLNISQGLPDYHKRNATSDSVYTELIAANATCTLQWQILKRYIAACIPPSEQAEHINLAGGTYYTKACLKHWESSRQLFLAAQAYLNQYSERLKANENMPSHFVPSFTLAYTQFSKHLFTYQQSENKARQVAKEKIEHNNTLFSLITEICNDGQLIFRHQKEKRQLYTFSKLLQLSKHKITSVENATKIPQPNTSNYYSTSAFNQSATTKEH